MMQASEMAMSKKDWASLHSKNLVIIQDNWDGWSGAVVAVVWSSDDDAPGNTADMALARRLAAADDLLEALRRAHSRLAVLCPLDGPDAASDAELRRTMGDAIQRAEGR